MVSRAAAVSMMAAVGGCIAIVIFSIIMEARGKIQYFLDVHQFVSSINGALVAVSGSAGTIDPWMALIVGFLGSVLANGGKIFTINIFIHLGEILYF